MAGSGLRNCVNWRQIWQFMQLRKPDPVLDHNMAHVIELSILILK